MKRRIWLLLGLALAAGSPSIARYPRRRRLQKFGFGAAYEDVGKIPVLHEGTRKAARTRCAREEIKQIFGQRGDSPV